jgi:phosphotransferase system enzyme I (PtsI)
MLRGLGVSSGIVYGRALVLDPHKFVLNRKSISSGKEAILEIARFRSALKSAAKDLQALKSDVRRSVGADNAGIFEAHILLLRDPAIIDRVIKTIKEQLVVAEWAVQEVFQESITTLGTVDDQYLRERIGDLEDVRDRVLRNLLDPDFDPDRLPELKDETIVVAHALSPSQTVSFRDKRVVGFAVEVGGPTSHSAIIAKSLRIPAAVGFQDIVNRIKTGDMIVLDGNEGTILINPSATLISEARNKARKYSDYANELLSLMDVPAETLDGHRIHLRANIELVDEMENNGMSGAEGVGLYRSEFLFLKCSPRLPTEEEHFQVYRKLAEMSMPHFAVIRTLDLGGEKFFHEVLESDEMNPVMGLRAIRLCLKRKDLFRTQLRAILRAGLYGKLRLMFPLISGVRELRVAKMVLDEVKEGLHREGQEFDEKMKLGIMIEVPSAATISDLLAREVDFFSIGTNDLIQYCLATDRGNDSIAHLYTPLHPAILRTLKFVVESANANRIEVSMCGEMASDPLYALILLGLGLRELSMHPTAIPIIKNVIRSIRIREARSLVKKIMGFATEQEIREYVLETMIYKFPKGLICQLH